MTTTADPDSSTGVEPGTGSGESGTTMGAVDTTAGETTAADTTEGESTGPGVVCGDDVVEGREQCDGAELAGEDCMTQGFDAGELACADDCTFDISGCMMFACGNGMLEGAETCDGAELAGEDCVSQGFDAGELACADDCSAFDTTGCLMFACGNDTIEGMEVCDGAALGGETCVTQGYDAGTLGCLGDCTGYDTTGCMMVSCGNDVIEGMEVCDGAALGGETCVTQGYDAGTLGCLGDCTGYDTTGCMMVSCGNDVVEGMEVCDGTDLSGQDCLTQGFDGGTLGCLGDCSAYDTTGCTDYMGDCCAGNGTVGCDDPACTAAVCAVDSYCCETEWDSTCATQALLEPACLGVGGTCPTAYAGDCCAGNGTPGCDDAGCTAAICAADPFCCSTEWDATCAGDAVSEPACFGVGGSCPEPGGDCCAANGTPECDDAACTAAVCAVDPYCCNTEWDDACASQALLEPTCLGAGGSCPAAYAGDCCADNGSPGCDDSDCTVAICAADPYCCSTEWDGPCAAAAVAEPACQGVGGTCPGGGGGGLACVEQDVGGALGAPVSSGSTAAEDDDLDPSCGGLGGNDHVVSFTAPAAGVFVFDTIGSAFDTKLALYDDCGAPSEVACNDDVGGGPTESWLALEMTAGQTVLVVIDGYNGATGDWVLNIAQPALVGDCCAANGSVACSDLGCTGAICEADAYCCGVDWDGICADAALVEPDCVGAGGSCP